MKRLRFTIVKNVVANLMRGGATALVALALPHFLVKCLDRDKFAAWSLMLQIAAYASYLDFGLQTAVARFVARYTELGDDQRRDSLISTAFVLLTGAAVLATVGFALIVWKLPQIFAGVPFGLLPELRWAVTIVAAGAILLLPLSTFSGVLIGLHRNEYVALAIGGSRLLGAITVLIAVRHTASLVVMGACVAITAALGGLVQFLAAKRLLPSLAIKRSLLQPVIAMDLAKFCGGLTAWSVSMFLVTGLDLTIVGIADFSAVGYYSVSAALVTVFAGANTAVSAALMTPFAALHASGQNERTRSLVLTTTRLNTFINLVLTLGMFLFGRFFLGLWVGEAYAAPAVLITEILMVANTVRHVGNPYASMLIATGQQKFGIAQGVVEGVVNLVASITGAVWFGAAGVAWGTLIGAFCGIAWTCTLTMKWASDVPLGRWRFAFEGVVRPVLSILPLGAFVVVQYHRASTAGSFAVLAIGVAVTSYLAHSLGVLTFSSRRMEKPLLEIGCVES